MIILLAIPRFALSGGNLVSMELAKHLQARGYKVYCHSGFSIKLADKVILKKPRRGKINSFLNLFSFFFISLCGLFFKNYIATHHLTAVFNFIKKSKYALVQDLEVDFYPKNYKKIGCLLWRNYIRSKNLIFTNKYLGEKIDVEASKMVRGFSFVPFDFVSKGEKAESEVDALAIIRDGVYKGPQKTVTLMARLSNANLNIKLINASRQKFNQDYVIDNINRCDFLDILNKAKVFICMSKWEGLGLPNIEAYMLGCKIVSTPIPSALLLKNISDNSVSIINEKMSIEEISNEVSRLILAPILNFDEKERRKEIIEMSHLLWLGYATHIIERG